MQSQPDWSADTADGSRRRRLVHRVDAFVGDDPEIRALWAAAASAERDSDNAPETRASRTSPASGDVVRLAVHEGSLRAGMTGVVVQAFRNGECDLVMVAFGRATRVVQATALEAVRPRAAAPDESNEAAG
jgi:hypothetical protein